MGFEPTSPLTLSAGRATIAPCRWVVSKTASSSSAAIQPGLYSLILPSSLYAMFMPLVICKDEGRTYSLRHHLFQH